MISKGEQKMYFKVTSGCLMGVTTKAGLTLHFMVLHDLSVLSPFLTKNDNKMKPLNSIWIQIYFTSIRYAVNKYFSISFVILTSLNLYWVEWFYNSIKKCPHYNVWSFYNIFYHSEIMNWITFRKLQNLMILPFGL